MHATSISAPVRTVMMFGRISPKALPSVAFPANSTTLYQTLCQARPASTSAQTKASFKAPCARPQVQMPTYRVASMRANSTVSEATRKEAAKLTWNEFFQLRASRRRYSLASSVVSSMASTVIGVQVLSSQDLEALGAQVMGLDPFVVLGMATAACGAVGWLIGPFVGNAAWGLVNRRYKQAFMIVSFLFFLNLQSIYLVGGIVTNPNPITEREGVL